MKKHKTSMESANATAVPDAPRGRSCLNSLTEGADFNALSCSTNITHGLEGSVSCSFVHQQASSLFLDRKFVTIWRASCLPASSMARENTQWTSPTLKQRTRPVDQPQRLNPALDLLQSSGASGKRSHSPVMSSSPSRQRCRRSQCLIIICSSASSIKVSNRDCPQSCAFCPRFQ